MKDVLCNEVWVKFTGGHNGQHVRFSDGPTTAAKLAVSEDGTRLLVKYINKQGFAVKVLGWPLQHVREYSLEGLDTPVTVHKGETPDPKS